MMKRTITLLLAAVLALGVTACGKTEPNTSQSTAVQPDSSTVLDSGSPQDSSAVVSSDAEPGTPAEVHIRLADWENIEWETYDGVYMTFKYPKGWVVTDTGTPPHNFYRVSRPTEDGSISNTGWVTTDSCVFFHTQEYADQLSKQDGKTYYATMKEPTTRAFYEAFWGRPELEVTRFEVVAETYNGDNAFIGDYSYTEQNNSKETDNSSILAHWTQKGVEGTGLYSATIMDYSLTMKVIDYDALNNGADPLNLQMVDQDCGFYAGYGLRWFCAPTDEFENWLPILKESYDSAVPTQAYWDAINEYNRAMFGSSWVDVGSDTYESDTVTDTWWDMYQEREKTDDIIREKRSDEILDYERVYDNDTGNIYKAYSGFMDDYQKSELYKDGDDGTRYSYATDDQYTQGFSGWIDGYGDYLEK